MKPILICTLLVLATFVGFSQNYYEEYPINVSIGTNGSLSRLECSTYDSVLQTTVSMNTDWLPYNHIVTGNAGKIGYTLWNSFNTQIGKVGFIIYDSYSHEFISEVKNFTLTPSKDLNVICGPTWIDVVIQEPDGSSGYFNTHIYYRYNNVLRKWVDTYFFDLYDWSATQDIWTMGSIGNTDRLFDADDNSFIYYDPVIDSLNFKEDYISGNIDWVKDWEDCYIGEDDVATPFNEFYMYDPSIHQLAKYPRTNLIGDEAKGIFYGFDQDSTFKNFFFLYDLSIQQWITDSVFNSYITNIIIKDRVVAWQVHAYGVYFCGI
ncbi:MAG: hypothetical protein IPP71_10870 [Bacteroidetes bacterium]|nr:hypothetical protein [Bacteroidota bacterium]